MYTGTIRKVAVATAIATLPWLVGPVPAAQAASRPAPLAAAAPEATAEAADPVRIMPLGDSITGSPGCWRALLWQMLQENGYTDIDMVGSLSNPNDCSIAFDGDNEGHGGYLVTGIAEKDQLPAWLDAANPDVVLMHLGTNDVWSAKTTKEILAAYTELVEQMRANNPSVAVLVARIIPVAPDNDCSACPQRTVELNNAIPEWADSLSTDKSPVVPVDLWSDWDPIADTGDGVHPNKAGIQRVAERWYTPLSQLLDGKVPAGSTEEFTYVASTTTRTTTVKPPIVASSPARTLFSFESGTAGLSTTTTEAVLDATTAFHTDGDSGIEVVSPNGTWVGSNLPEVQDWSGNPAVTYDVRTGADGTSTNIAVQTGDDWDWCQGTTWGWVGANSSATVTVPLNDLSCSSELPADLTKVRKINIFFSPGTFQLDTVSLTGLDAEASAEASAEPTAEPTAEASPEPTAEPTVTPALTTAPEPTAEPVSTRLFSFETGVQRWSVGGTETVVRQTDAFHTDGDQGLEIKSPVADGDWAGVVFSPARNFSAATTLSYDIKAGEEGTATNVAIQTGDDWAWCAGPDWPWVNPGDTATIDIDLSTLSCGTGQTLKLSQVQKLNIFVNQGTNYLDNIRIDADVPVPTETVKPIPTGLTEVTDFGENPTSARMFLHVPTTLPDRPAVLVANHWCSGDGIDMYSGTEFKTLADTHGFIVIYPSSTNGDMCWDVASKRSLTHDGGGDSTGIANMVRYVLDEYDADPARVFSTGVSSGAMMTNVLMATYPDLFAGGAVFAGVPHGCFGGPTRWNSDCATGALDKTAEEWGDLVRDAYPGYEGPRPRVQLWHGDKDTTLAYANFAEEIEQWTDVLGLDATPTSTDEPKSGWTRTRYADEYGTVLLEAISMGGVTHDLLKNGMAAEAIAFFGLDD